MNRLIRIALTFLLVMTSGVIQAEIVIYPVPQGIYYARHNDDYTVKVRHKRGGWSAPRGREFGAAARGPCGRRCR